MDKTRQSEDANSQDAKPNERFIVPAELFLRYYGLQNRTADLSVPPNTHTVYHVFDGTRRIDTYESEEKANEKLRTEFQRQHPDVPFTPEAALHGTDEQGRTLWSFAVVPERAEGPSRRQALEQAWKDNELRQKLDHQREHPRRKLEQGRCSSRSFRNEGATRIDRRPLSSPTRSGII